MGSQYYYILYPAVLKIVNIVRTTVCLSFLTLDPGALQIIEAVMLTSKGRGRFSSHILAAALLQFFSENKLLPKGMTVDMECVENWSLKTGRAIQRLATRLT